MRNEKQIKPNTDKGRAASFLREFINDYLLNDGCFSFVLCAALEDGSVLKIDFASDSPNPFTLLGQIESVKHEILLEWVER